MQQTTMATKPSSKTILLFDGYVPGTVRATGYRCNITVLDTDPYNWRIMVYFPGDSCTDKEVLSFRFRVRPGEEVSEATERLAQKIREHRIVVTLNELEEKLQEEEFSIEKEIPHVLH